MIDLSKFQATGRETCFHGRHIGAQIYAGLPQDWLMFIEHKMYEPAFYATVIADWGSNLIAAQSLGLASADTVAAKSAFADAEIDGRIAAVTHHENMGRADFEAVVAARATIDEVGFQQRPGRAHFAPGARSTAEEAASG